MLGQVIREVSAQDIQGRVKFQSGLLRKHFPEAIGELETSALGDTPKVL